MKRGQPLPPKYAENFLHWFLKEDLLEEVAGDLEEKFNKNIKNRSPLRQSSIIGIKPLII